MSSKEIIKSPEQLNNQKLVELLQDLIRIPSWVPSETNLKSVQNENQLVDYLENWLKKNTHLDVYRQNLADGRFNLIARRGNPDIVLLAHTDTVQPSADAPYDQFAAEIHDGKVWGLGSADMKSGIAAISQAISLSPDVDNIVYMLYADEEYDFLGMNGLIKDYGNLKPKFIISGDGSELKIGHGCRGLIEIRARVIGQTGHAAKGNGLSSIDGASNSILKLGDYLKNFEHPVMGKTSLNVAYLFGGKKFPGSESFSPETGFLTKVGQEGNVIADIAEFVIDVRPASPDLSSEKIIDFLNDFLVSCGYKFEVVKLRHDYGAWYTDLKDIQSFREIAQRTRGMVDFDFAKPGESGYLDIQMLWEKLGRPPSLSYGAAMEAVGHKANEHIGIEELIKTRNFFLEVLKTLSNK